LVFQPLCFIFLGLFSNLFVKLCFFLWSAGDFGLVPLLNEFPGCLCDPGLFGVFGLWWDGLVSSSCEVGGDVLPLAVNAFLGCGVVLWFLVVACKLCIESLGLVLVGVPEEGGWSLALWIGAPLDPECCLYEVVVGGQ